MDITEGCCFRATPLHTWNNCLTLRTIDQEKTKEELEDLLDGIFVPEVLLPPRKKPSFEPGEWWAIRSKIGSWERVQVCKERRKKPIESGVGNGDVVDQHGLQIKLYRSDPNLQKIPDDKLYLIADIPPVCHTVVIDPTFQPDPQLVGSLDDLAARGDTEIMCYVRGIDPDTSMPVVVWYPSTDMRFFERRIELNSSPPLRADIVPVEGEAAEVFIVWLTAEKSARLAYSVVFGNATSANENAPYFRFQKQLLEIQTIARGSAPWEWTRGPPTVGTKLLYECDGVRVNVQKMGAAWVRAMVSSVEFDAVQKTWRVVVSLVEMGNRKVLVTGSQLLSRLRQWRDQLDKFDTESPVPVVTCRLQGFATNADMRMDREGFAFMQHLNDSVVLFLQRESDALENVVYQTVMLGTDWRRRNRGGNPYVDVGQMLCSVDLATNARAEVTAQMEILCGKIEGNLQFPVGSDALHGWPQNPLLSNRMHVVHVLRADSPSRLVVQLLTDDSRRMLRTMAALYKSNSALPKNFAMNDLPLEKQFAAVVRLKLNEFAAYGDGVFPLCANKDGSVFLRAMVIRRKLWKEQSVEFYAIDFDFVGKAPITAVFYLFDLATLRIPPISVQCRMNVSGQPINVKHFKMIMMSDEFYAIFGPPTPAPMENRRYVWLLRKNGVLLDVELIAQNGLQRPDGSIAQPPFPVHLIQEEFERTTAKLTGRYLYDVCCPIFVDADDADGEYDFKVIDERAVLEERHLKRFLPKLLVRSRIEGLDSTARSLLSKLPIGCEGLSQHLHLTPMIAPVSSLMGPNGLIYSSRLFLGLSNDKRYDVGAMLSAWRDATKWSREHRCLIVRENRFHGSRDLSFSDPQWPTPLHQRLLCSVSICWTTPKVVFLRPVDWLRWERVVFNRCQELYSSGQAKLMRSEDLISGAGMACLALWPKDGKLYRAEIVSMQNGLTVFFVDYGNQLKNVSIADLFIPPPDLLAIPKLIFHVQELDYAPPNDAIAWSAFGVKAYEEMVGACTVVEITSSLPNGVYNAMFFLPTLGDGSVASNVRLMEKLHYEQMCCEKVDLDERRHRIATASDVAFLKRWPRTTPPDPESLPAYIRAVTFVTSPHQVFVIAKGCYHDSWKALGASLSEELLMTRVAANRVWPGRLVAAPYYGGFFRAVVLSVDEIVGCVDVAYIDWGNRSSVPLYALMELSPALVVGPGSGVNLTRLKLDGVIDDSIPVDFNAAVSDKVYEWLTTKVADAAFFNTRKELRAICKRRNELDGVLEFVVDVKCDEDVDCWTEVSAACPKISPRIRKARVRTAL